MRSLTISLVLVGLLATAACGDDDNPTAPTTGAVIALSGNLAFGNVTVGSTATATLTITNGGASPLTISGVAYPAGFTGNFTSGTVAPGASQAVTVTFAPTAGTPYTGNITVTGNQTSGTNTIAVSGNGGVATTYTLTGTVTESAPTLSTVLAGVTVRILDGANAGKSAVSGADGRYEITGVVNGGYTITATLAGYTPASLPIGIDGNTTFTIRLDPVTARTRFGPGTYRVNTDIPAGLYYSDPGHGCRFRRLSGFGGTSGDILANTQLNFEANQWIVQLVGTDAGFETDAACGFWHTTPRRGLESNITAGAWLVGAQVNAGTYQAASAAAGCEWQRLRAFTGTGDAVIASAFVSTAGVQVVTIAGTDIGFSSTPECGTWTRTGS